MIYVIYRPSSALSFTQSQSQSKLWSGREALEGSPGVHSVDWDCSELSQPSSIQHHTLSTKRKKVVTCSSFSFSLTARLSTITTPYHFRLPASGTTNSNRWSCSWRSKRCPHSHSDLNPDTKSTCLHLVRAFLSLTLVEASLSLSIINNIILRCVEITTHINTIRMIIRLSPRFCGYRPRQHLGDFELFQTKPRA